MSLYRAKSRRRVTTEGFGSEVYSKSYTGKRSKKKRVDPRFSDTKASLARMRAEHMHETQKPLSPSERKLAWIKKRHELYKLSKKYGVKFVC